MMRNLFVVSLTTICPLRKKTDPTGFESTNVRSSGKIFSCILANVQDKISLDYVKEMSIYYGPELSQSKFNSANFPSSVTLDLSQNDNRYLLLTGGTVSGNTYVNANVIVGGNAVLSSNSLSIGGNLVISPGTLGSSVSTSSLTTVGNLSTLQVTGNTSISNGTLFVGGPPNTYSNTVLTQGALMTWNSQTQGETDFINKYGTGVGGFYFFTSAGSGNTWGSANPIATITNSVLAANNISANVAMSVGANTLSVPSGFVFRTIGYASLQQVCFYVTSQPLFTVGYKTSYFQANATPVTVVQQMPSYYSSATYGLQNSGTFNGFVVVPVSGIYAVTGTARFQDNTTTTVTGMCLTSYNGTTTNTLLPGDGQSFATADANGRRSACQSGYANIAAGVGLSLTTANGTTAFVNWAAMTVQLVYAI